MSRRPIYIAGVGSSSPLGQGAEATWRGLMENRSGIAGLQRFAVPTQQALPVGEVPNLADETELPRTHRLALTAAGEAMATATEPPQAVVIGTTTGGMERSERRLRHGSGEKAGFSFHGLHTVSREVARAVGCDGPALTVSTACSSGALAIALAIALLRRGTVRTVLAGGADSLCRLTYFGFHCLQLVDRRGCRPLDAERQGMVVGEGAGMLLLTSEAVASPLAELLGVGLGCDAYHPAAPHPEGRGALAAMGRALADAGLAPEDIDYLNLHGTGTPDNDRAEAMAVRRLFAVPPPHSSTKGATGHTLAAAGAIEAVVAAQAVRRGWMPGNIGLKTLDATLGLSPLGVATSGRVRAVLSNSFGFGGNNGVVVVAEPGRFPGGPGGQTPPALAVHGFACLSGAGGTASSLAALAEARSLAGSVPLEQLGLNLPPALVRRAKRLPRLFLSLAALVAAGEEVKPEAIFAASGWGGLSETHDFLERLTASGELHPSPIDFVGSVHNASAGLVAMLHGADGPNLTQAGGDASFEEALLSAEHLHLDPSQPALLLAADEAHPRFSPLFDPSIAPDTPLAEGGGALLVSRSQEGAICQLFPLFHGSGDAPQAVSRLGAALSGRIGREAVDLFLVGIPAGEASQGEAQLAQLLATSRLAAPLCRYRRFTGEFASASALAAALAVAILDTGRIPLGLTDDAALPPGARCRRILLLGLGATLTAALFSACPRKS